MQSNGPGGGFRTYRLAILRSEYMAGLRPETVAVFTAIRIPEIHRGEYRRSCRKQQDFVGAIVHIAIPVCVMGEFRHRSGFTDASYLTIKSA